MTLVGVEHFQTSFADHLTLLGQQIGVVKDVVAVRAFQSAGLSGGVIKGIASSVALV